MAAKTKHVLGGNFCMLFLILLCGAPALLSGQSIADTLRRIDALMNRINAQSPGAALRISRGNTVLYSKGFGMAHLEHKVPITDHTIFEAGSVSKQFTASAILLLIAEGKIHFEDDIRKFIPEFPDYGYPIQIRHLLNHTSGVRDWGALAALGGWPRGTRVYNNQIALSYILRQEGLNNKPGEEYLYSNSNYTLLTIIVERVSGQSLPEFTEERIFAPLGMKNTLWRNNFREVVDKRAVGYEKKDGRYISDMPFENTYGHAALLTNVIDLDLWNKSWKDDPLWGDSLLRWRMKRGVLNNGRRISYASGVVIGNYAGHPEVSHSGATAGYRCWLAYYPEEDLSVVYLSNSTEWSTTGTGRSIAGIFFGKELNTKKEIKKQEVNILPHTLKNRFYQWTGNYYSRECDGTVTIKYINDSLFMYNKAGIKTFLKPEDGSHFRINRSTSLFFQAYGESKKLYISVPRARKVKFESR